MRINRLSWMTLALVAGGCADFGPTQELVIPLDDRPVMESRVTPPPISGGTLAILGDGHTVIATDPDRDRVLFADIDTGLVSHALELEPGDEPGRVIEGPDGTAFVALRGVGSIATVEVAGGAVLARRHACAGPRGMAYRAETDELHVACASGELVTFALGGASPSRTLDLGADLRDVVLSGAGLRVTRFETGDTLVLNAAAEVLRVMSAPSVDRLSFGVDGEVRTPMAPSQAWRAVTAVDGSTVVVHQRGQSTEVVLTEPTVEQPSSYGGGGGFGLESCGGIVEGAVTMIDPSGNVRTSPGLAGAVLPVDVAIAPDGRIAIANAGPRDTEMPRPFVEFHGEDGVDFAGGGAPLPPPEASNVLVIHSADLGPGGEGTFCSFGSGVAPIAEPVVAVAFAPDGRLVAQTREPARLHVLEIDLFRTQHLIELGGEARLDTGHEIFHRDTGAGIACASCHGEGGEDGRVWRFSGLGPRRTQALNVGLESTAPFHWDGTLGSLGALMDEVFVGRMGGVHESAPRLAALEGFLFGLEPETARVDPSDPAAVRGQAVFSRAGCDGCHNGEGFTNNATVDVGTGGALQVPSLVGIGYRAPFLHDGCAETLHDRFDPACGGAAHGSTESLAPSEIDDLVAYLESL